MLRSKKPKFVVQTSDGAHVDFHPCTRVKAYTDGLVVFYKDPDGRLDMVGFNRKYRPLERNGVFYVGKNIGNDSAAALITLHENGKKDGDEVPAAADIVGASTDPDCPGDDLSELMRANIYGVGLQSITEEKPVNKRLIIIIIVAFVIGFIVIRSGLLAKLLGG
jgi:hypothetical protein